MNNKLLLATIILIFCIFASYNISLWIISHNYNESSNLNTKIDKVIDLVSDNEEAVKELEQINDQILFINAFCFDKEIEAKQ